MVAIFTGCQNFLHLYSLWFLVLKSLFCCTNPVTNLTTEASQGTRWFCHQGKFCVDWHSRYIFNSYSSMKYYTFVELIDFDTDNSGKLKLFNYIFLKSWECVRIYKLNFLKQQLQMYINCNFFFNVAVCFYRMSEANMKFRLASLLCLVAYVQVIPKLMK